VATFSVILPTISRPSLSRSIASVIDQLEHDDELIVVGDGRQDGAADVVESFQPANLLYVEAEQKGSRFGNAQRTFAMQLALGRSSHLLFIDDDDVYVHGALDVVRQALDNADVPNAAHIFKATWGNGHHAQGVTLWDTPEVRAGNIGSPMCVLPNRPYARSWFYCNDHGRNGITSDFGFLSAAIGECGGVEWHDSLVAIVRP